MNGQIQFATLEELYLDPQNPRLGRAAHTANLPQEEVYKRMRDWSLEELATSFLESGFWPHEAVLCARESIGAEERLVVVEGNRRVAALKRLKRAFEGEERSQKWADLVSDFDEPDTLFSEIPYLELADREEIDAFLGFRHVTGIKEWAPPEKAQFIARLIDKKGLSYREVMRQIGSKTPVVERNYIAYCILLQMETVEGLAIEEVENRFSVLFLSLRSRNIQKFLGIEDKFGIDPHNVKPPIAPDYLSNLKEFSQWLFGDSDKPPVVRDSREVDRFAKVLSSEEGLSYLRSVRSPSLEKAFVVAGGDREEIYDLISSAAYNIQEALSSIHLYKDNRQLIDIARRLVANADQVKKTLEL